MVEGFVLLILSIAVAHRDWYSLTVLTGGLATRGILTTQADLPNKFLIMSDAFFEDKRGARIFQLEYSNLNPWLQRGKLAAQNVEIFQRKAHMLNLLYESF